MAKDKYHNLVKQALIDDGWTITHDPFEISSILSDFEIDLGAEKFIAAEKGTEKIAIEIKSFLGKSRLHDFFKAIGQFGFYYMTLKAREPRRTLFLAIPDTVWDFLSKDPNTLEISRINHIKFILYNIEKQKIMSWIK